ncbi:hypothetical protein C723_2238 [Christiangramia flava JLT2011]|uniref:Uncharacterized protein n=1 Tax=Christiangramia flava JLT2011 TaxID=1229726 RepID=A0A1L7I7Q8_9FLAO|nr:hypothetical protein GRFL_2530 [Christiangramia flava JLT2011]OSS38847.1 hypothetical protein C723_2238 [Christiangramia flava JLT2011]
MFMLFLFRKETKFWLRSLNFTSSFLFCYFCNERMLKKPNLFQLI